MLDIPPRTVAWADTIMAMEYLILFRRCRSIMINPKSWILFVLFVLTYITNHMRKQSDEIDPNDLSPKHGVHSHRFYEYYISRTWDDRPVSHAEVLVRLTAQEQGIKMEVEAPFFDDPQRPPKGKAGEPYSGLWDYEVVEAFFLTDENKYLEVELAPHGEHLVLMLNSYRDTFKQEVPLNYSAKIAGKSWLGTAFIPGEYLPPKVTKFNAYAIHGSGDKRVYEALYPVPTGKFESPDFHRLDYFNAIPDFPSLLPSNWDDSYKSAIWTSS